jgi:hypothetical protein
MHKSATKCNETLRKWCKNKHGASKIMDTLETYQHASSRSSSWHEKEPWDHLLYSCQSSSPHAVVRLPVNGTSGLTSGPDEPEVGPDEAHESNLGDATLPPQIAGCTTASSHLRALVFLLRASQPPRRPPRSRCSRVPPPVPSESSHAMVPSGHTTPMP